MTISYWKKNKLVYTQTRTSSIIPRSGDGVIFLSKDHYIVDMVVFQYENGFDEPIVRVEVK